MDAESSFEVQAEAITRQAETVDEVADQVVHGRSAASAITIGRDAYGFLCRIIPTLLDPVQEATADALQQAADALQRSADDLRTTARAYASADERTAAELRGRGGP